MTSTADDRNLRTLEQVSAGGVAFRVQNSVTEIVIVRVVPELRWQLPKGLIDPGETLEQAAVREVREESGVVADLISPIETIEYWFIADRNGQRWRYHKFVHFFLMKYRSGDITDHDDEVDEVRWVTAETALEMLKFKSEREVVEKAVAMIV